MNRKIETQNQPAESKQPARFDAQVGRAFYSDAYEHGAAPARLGGRSGTEAGLSADGRSMYFGAPDYGSFESRQGFGNRYGSGPPSGMYRGGSSYGPELPYNGGAGAYGGGPPGGSMDGGGGPGRLYGVNAPSRNGGLGGGDYSGMHRDGFRDVWTDRGMSHGEPNGSTVASQPKAIYDYLMSKGFNAVQAAGILGNFQTESRFNPGAYNRGEGAIGLAQWEGGRRRALENFAQQQGKPVTDTKVQLDFMLHELNTTERGALAALLRAQTPSQAAQAFQSKYERSANLGTRPANAEQLYRSLNGSAPGPGFGNDGAPGRPGGDGIAGRPGGDQGALQGDKQQQVEQAQRLLSSNRLSSEQKLKVADMLARAGVDHIQLPDKDGNWRNYSIRTEQLGDKKIVNMFSQDEQGKDHVVLRALMGADGSVHHQKDKHGHEVNLEGDWWSRNMAGRTAISGAGEQPGQPGPGGGQGQMRDPYAYSGDRSSQQPGGGCPVEPGREGYPPQPGGEGYPQLPGVPRQDSPAAAAFRETLARVAHQRAGRGSGLCAQGVREALAQCGMQVPTNGSATGMRGNIAGDPRWSLVSNSLEGAQPGDLIFRDHGPSGLARYGGRNLGDVGVYLGNGMQANDHVQRVTPNGPYYASMQIYRFIG